jgi:hypothetical protein
MELYLVQLFGELVGELPSFGNGVEFAGLCQKLGAADIRTQHGLDGRQVVGGHLQRNAGGPCQ